MTGEWVPRNGKWAVRTALCPTVSEVIEVAGKDKIVRAIIGPAPDGNGWLVAVMHNWRDDVKSHVESKARSTNRAQRREAQNRAR